MSVPRASSALSRFTVLDLTRVRAGPTAVRQLADWGANVIKVELPAHLETGEGLGGARHGPDFQNLHRNKRAIRLNLKSPQGVEVFRRLATKADVVVENYRPDVKKRLGIDYATLSKINPRFVYASISGFGQDGPYADRPGFDQIAQGMGGLMSITGEPGRGPMRVGIPIADLSAGLFCALGILVALLEREQSGKGQEVATSLLQAQIFMLDFQASRWLNDREVPPQAGNNHPTSIPTGVFKTRDGHINIAAAGSAIWERLCRAIGAEADRPPRLRYGVGPLQEPQCAQRGNRSVSRGRHQRRMGGAPECGWRSVRARSIRSTRCSPIRRWSTWVSCSGSRRAMRAARSTSSASRCRWRARPSKLVAAPPECGEHTHEVLHEFGFSEDEIAGLRNAKVI